MTIHIELESDLERHLEHECRRSGETIEVVAKRLLRYGIRENEPSAGLFGPEGVPEKWHGMTPSEIDSELEIEHYLEKLERTRHESAPVRS